MMLDLESVRLFALVAEYGNLTRAAEAAGTVQPVVSQRIKSLEAALGRRLLDRSPRLVRLTEAGTAFLDHARALLAVHEAAIAAVDIVPSHITIGISDHALGTHLDLTLKRVRMALPPHATMAVHLGQSADIRDRFEGGQIDLAIIRREHGAEGGEMLGTDALQWRVPPGWSGSDGPLPLVLLPSPCSVRAVAIRVLDQAGIPWRETFTGGSCLALMAAVRAGLGVAPLGTIIGGDLAVAPVSLGMPPLPPSQIVMLARTPNPATSAAARALAASVRDLLA